MRHIRALALLVFCLSTAAPAASQGEPAAPGSIERFVALVRAGQDLRARGSEFHSMVSRADAADLRTIARCEPAEPRYLGESRATALILWDCSGQPGLGSMGTMLDLREGRITRITLMTATLIPTANP